jgi:FkbM family methyltransferase
VRVLDAATVPGTIEAILSNRPASLTSHLLARSLKTAVRNLGTVFDVGANTGQFARAISRFYPEAAIVCFEPLPDVARRLLQNLADLRQVSVRCTALADRDGEAPFYRNRRVQASSLLPLRRDHRPALAGLAVSETLTVPLARLDTETLYLPIRRPSLLKLDVQGAEGAVLRGARDTLNRIDHVVTEVSLEPSYTGESSLEELMEVLGPYGLRLTKILNASRDEEGNVFQLDVLFSLFSRTRAHGRHGADSGGV